MNSESQKILSAINQLENNLLLVKEKSFEILGISSNYLGSCSKSLKIKEDKIQEFAEYIGMIPEDILKGEIDLKLIKKHLYKNQFMDLPEKYSKGAGSYISGIRTIYIYVNKTQGNKAAQEMIRHFNIPKKSLFNDNNKNNLLLVNDLFDYCILNFNFKRKDFIELAYSQYFEGERKAIFEIASSCTNIRSLLSMIVKNSNLYEMNFFYQLVEVSDKLFIIRSESRPNINDELSKINISSLENNFYKAKVIEIIPTLVGLPPIKVKPLKSLKQNGRQIIHYVINVL